MHAMLEDWNASSDEVSHFVQWSDMLIFDYIICQNDRYEYTLCFTKWSLLFTFVGGDQEVSYVYIGE